MGDRRSAGMDVTSQAYSPTQPSTLGGTARSRNNDSEPGSRIDEVSRRRARLVLGWVTVVLPVTPACRLDMQQASHPARLSLLPSVGGEVAR